ncbi:OTU-like cysteine protease, putative [Talaromyces stipitatus ATCC 10500]|uniref:Ubiquitin thioesterase OTU n=1 Tax=Talaromyces stipitatus (strain ATCC 10500 / CBS 375.48 / QM 6759 / NRRL 1006) TaxID=441959 RepID=B8MNQ3_TALSN|nr:OTU-like cysteine protease, putative [Talaromyces stipitatus ATCC 10500]EED14142.1 OTU-like cysteine protease, putative [Talaromyces stipitatus ATCC 10500]
MRVRVRGPTGQNTITFDQSTTVADFTQLIKDNTGLTSFEPLRLEEYDPTQKIAAIGVNLNGEQLIVNSKQSTEPARVSQQQDRSASAPQQQQQKQPPSRVTPEEDTEPPEIPSPEHGGTVVLRIMPDDNSCLFRAVGGAIMGGMDTMTELRSIVAQTIQAQPDVYTDVVLERNADDYCRWIQSEDAWGGAIELGILSKHFDVEICSIDVQTLRVDHFNEGQRTRCFVVYSGIHYDMIAFSPSAPPYTHANASPDFDTRIFDAADPVIMEKALELCRILQQRHYYTNTATFRIRCNTCGGMFVGEKGATEHATKTGHYDFGEAS